MEKWTCAEVFCFFSPRTECNDGIQKYQTKRSTLHTVCNNAFLMLASVGVQEEPLLKPLAFTDKTLDEALTMAMAVPPG